MKKLICECCRTPIDRLSMKCEYCGTMYREENDNVIRIETFHNPIKVYKSSIMINNENMELLNNGLSDYLISNLSRKLADATKENLTLCVDNYPDTNSQVITAKIRVVAPNYTF